MKNLRTTLKAIAAAALASACGLASAGGSTTLSVTATVAGVCKFNAATQSVAIPLDPSAAGAATGNWSVLYRCTKNTDATGVTATGGTSRTLTNATHGDIAYTITISGDTEKGTGFGAGGSDLTATVGYSVPLANFADKPAATYTDSIVLNILP